LMRAMWGTEVPPNFTTRRAMAACAVLRGFEARDPLYGEPPREKARIHSGGAGGAQTRLGGGGGDSGPPRRASTVDEAEVTRFSALAAQWWDPRGKMAVLHKFNPVRL